MSLTFNHGVDKSTGNRIKINHEGWFKLKIEKKDVQTKI